MVFINYNKNNYIQINSQRLIEYSGNKLIRRIHQCEINIILFTAADILTATVDIFDSHIIIKDVYIKLLGKEN